MTSSGATLLKALLAPQQKEAALIIQELLFNLSNGFLSLPSGSLSLSHRGDQQCWTPSFKDSTGARPLNEQSATIECILAAGIFLA